MSRKEVGERILNCGRALEKALAIPDLLGKHGVDPRLLARIKESLDKAAACRAEAEVKRAEVKRLESCAETTLEGISEAMRFVKRVVRIEAARVAREAPKSDKAAGPESDKAATIAPAP